MCVAVLLRWMSQRRECYAISPRLLFLFLPPIPFSFHGKANTHPLHSCFSYGNCWTVCAPLVDLLPGLCGGDEWARGTRTSVNKWIGSLQINALEWAEGAENAAEHTHIQTHPYARTQINTNYSLMPQPSKEIFKHDTKEIKYENQPTFSFISHLNPLNEDNLCTENSSLLMRIRNAT